MMNLNKVSPNLKMVLTMGLIKLSKRQPQRSLHPKKQAKREAVKEATKNKRNRYANYFTTYCLYV